MGLGCIPIAKSGARPTTIRRRWRRKSGRTRHFAKQSKRWRRLKSRPLRRRCRRRPSGRRNDVILSTAARASVTVQFFSDRDAGFLHGEDPGRGLQQIRLEMFFAREVEEREPTLNEEGDGDERAVDRQRNQPREI